MMHRIKYSKSLVESGGMIKKNGLSLLLLLKPQKGLVPSPEWVSDVAGVSSGFLSASAAASIGESSSLMKRDMFRARYLPNLFRGRQTGGCVGSFVPPQCSKSHMLPYFARSIVSSSVSQSSGQTKRQEPKKQRKECQIISSELQRERCDEISSTEVSLNQFPGLMVHGNVADSKTRRLLRLNPDTGYFEEQGVSAAASNHHCHYELQVPHGHVCRGSAYGWLFLTDDNIDMKLLNPFSGAEIQLPPFTTPVPIKGEIWFAPSKWYVNKAVFSANPSIEPRPVIFIIYNAEAHLNRLAFCKPGDKGWTHLEFSDLFLDAIYHKGRFYVLRWKGYVTAFDIGRCINDDDHSVKTTLIASPSVKSLCGRDMFFEPLQPKSRDTYLVVLDGELVKFELRSVSFHDSCIDETKDFLEREMNRDGDTSDEDFTNEDLFIYLMAKKARTIKMDPTWTIQKEPAYAPLEVFTNEESDDVDSDDGKKASNHEDFTDEESDDVDSDDGKKASNHEDFTDEESDDVDSDDEKKECIVDPRLYCIDPRATSCTYSIKISRLDASEKQWVKVESLGDKAVFLGFNTSFAISASDYPAGVCIPDSVYFIDGGGMYNMHQNIFYDMGIYNVKDKRLKPLYPQNVSKFIKPAPIWIVNSADS